MVAEVETPGKRMLLLSSRWGGFVEVAADAAPPDLIVAAIEGRGVPEWQLEALMPSPRAPTVFVSAGEVDWTRAGRTMLVSIQARPHCVKIQEREREQHQPRRRPLARRMSA